jgi:hypothetical protein
MEDPPQTELHNFIKFLSKTQLLGYRLKEQGSIPRRDEGFFIPYHIQIGFGALLVLYIMCTKGSFPRCKTAAA